MLVQVSAIIGYAIYWMIILTGFALFVWALVHFAEDNHQYNSGCSERMSGIGFVGNADFYGLGIRLGVYLQWIAQFLANCFLSAEWKTILGASIAFALALTIAVLLLTFEHECTFTAEIIVIIYIFWGGLIVSYYGSPILDNMGKPIPDRRFVGTNAATALPLLLMEIFSLWFWIRLATAGEIDYLPTPGHTFYFLLDRVSARSRPPARFMVFLCAVLIFSSFVNILVTVGGSFYWGLKHNGSAPSETNGDRASDSSRHSEDSTATITDTSSVSTPKENYMYVFRLERLHTSIIDDQRFRIGLSTFSILYSIIAIELTLVWNNVSGVYNVNSTGQVIPLIAGSGTLISVIWKMRHISVGISFS